MSISISKRYYGVGAVLSHLMPDVTEGPFILASLYASVIMAWVPSFSTLCQMLLRDPSHEHLYKQALLWGGCRPVPPYARCY